VAAGEDFELEFTVTAQGSRRRFEASGRPFLAGAEQGGVLVVRDVTDRSLLRLQNAFLSLASHELNTPLTAISGSLQVLLRQADNVDAGAQRRHFAEMGLAQVRRLGVLVQELGDIVRLQEGKFTLQVAPFDLAQLVRDTIDLIQVQLAGQTVRFDPEREPLIVSGDSMRLQQVVLNLLANAAKHASGSKFVDVRLREDTAGVHLEVEDYGPGIPEAALTKIFSRFFQVERRGNAAPGGLGLGLFIVDEIVRAHEGTVEVSSREGQGTRFTVHLPPQNS
jgi:two-component system CheB/CheR fusion protein